MSYFALRLHPFVKAFIISDALLYSSLNIVSILFALYVTTVVPGGTVQSATTAIAAGFVTRIMVELLVGRTSSRMSEFHKVVLIIGGLVAISMSYAGFALTHNNLGLILLWILNGFGWAIGHPAKLALVANHINPKQASQEWGFSDALNMSLIVIIMVIGSYIVSHFSYGLLFALAAIVNSLGLIPYALYAQSLHNEIVQNAY